MEKKINYLLIMLYGLILILSPLIYLQIIKKNDFTKVINQLKLANDERKLVESEIALAKFEIKDLTYDLDKKKAIITDTDGYLKLLKELEVNKFSINFETLNDILLENKIKLLTLKYDDNKFVLEAILNSKSDLSLFKDYKVDLKEVFFKNGKYISSIELTRRN